MGNCTKELNQQKAKQLARQKNKNKLSKNQEQQDIIVPTINIKKVNENKDININNPQTIDQQIKIDQQKQRQRQKQKINKISSALNVEQSDDFGIPESLNMQSNVVKKNKAI